MKDEDAIEGRGGRKDFKKLPLNKENKFKKGPWEIFWFWKVLFCVFGE